MRNSVQATCLAAGFAAALATAIAAQPAAAQSNPSAADLTNMLKPAGTLTDTTRGIKPISPGSSAGSDASATPAGAPSANLNVQFETGSATLTPHATATLDQLGMALTGPALSAYHFKIVGHTDTTGSDTINQSLSAERADTVKSYLESKFKISPDRLESLGVGESDPAIPTPPNTPEIRNRRVQIINIGQ